MTLVNVPQAAPVHAVPASPQLTPLLVESFCTVTVKRVDCDTRTEMADALKEMEICGALLVLELTRPEQETSAKHDNRASARHNGFNGVA